MASGPITSWEIDGETVETVSDFMFWGSKITEDGDSIHEIKRCLLLGRKIMTYLDAGVGKNCIQPSKIFTKAEKCYLFTILIKELQGLKSCN